MKKIYIIGGTMGVGKSTTCQELKKRLNNSVFLDGDWCWDAHPFQVTEETKTMVLDNICHMLNNFLKCSAYENIIFCWVMHQQEIIDSIVNRLETENCEMKLISLIADEDNLQRRLQKDIEKGIRQIDVLGRSLERISMYKNLKTIQIDTSNKTIEMIVDEISKL